MNCVGAMGWPSSHITSAPWDRPHTETASHVLPTQDASITASKVPVLLVSVTWEAYSLQHLFSFKVQTRNVSGTGDPAKSYIRARRSFDQNFPITFPSHSNEKPSAQNACSDPCRAPFSFVVRLSLPVLWKIPGTLSACPTLGPPSPLYFPPKRGSPRDRRLH